MSQVPPAQQWKQLQIFEQRGDLQKQADILADVLGPHLPPKAVSECLSMAWERAQQEQERQPPELLRLQQAQQTLELCDSRSGTVLKDVHLPRESGYLPAQDLNWSATGQVALQLLDIQGEKLLLRQAFKQLNDLQKGLLLNSAYAHANLSADSFQTSYFCRAFRHDQIPLEPVRSLPYDLFASPRHPVIAVSDRGAGKLYLFQRDTLRLQRAWPIVQPPNKKGLAVAFHPDGRRIFVSANQPGLLMLIDRGMAQKKIPLPASHLISNLMISNKGDLLYVLVISPDTRRPDIWVLDTQKYQRQAVISLEGEAFSAGADAHDLFELSPDGQSLVTMVSRDRPALFTPCLLLVSLQKQRIVDQVLLKPEDKPSHLAFPARTLVNPRLRLLPMLLHSGYGISEDLIKQVFGISSL